MRSRGVGNLGGVRIVLLFRRWIRSLFVQSFFLVGRLRGGGIRFLVGESVRAGSQWVFGLECQGVVFEKSRRESGGCVGMVGSFLRRQGVRWVDDGRVKDVGSVVIVAGSRVVGLGFKRAQFGEEGNVGRLVRRRRLFIIKMGGDRVGGGKGFRLRLLSGYRFIFRRLNSDFLEKQKRCRR